MCLNEERFETDYYKIALGAQCLDDGLDGYYDVWNATYVWPECVKPKGTNYSKLLVLYCILYMYTVAVKLLFKAGVKS